MRTPSDHIGNSKSVPVLVFVLIGFVFFMIPINILSKGYLPHDDALRHVAKVISGKEWQEILVLRPEILMDSHPGWHKILETIYRIGGMNARSLVMLSVALMFVWFAFVPLFFSKRPEAWLISLLIISMSDFGILNRLFLGRPYIFTSSWVLYFCFVWEKLKSNPLPFGVWMPLLLYTAAATWIHCNWVAFGFPVLCLLAAREWRAAANLCVIVIAAIMVGACLTGHPYLFLKQTLLHGYTSLTNAPHQISLVTEFQISSGTPVLVIAVILTIFAEIVRNEWDVRAIDNPVFILMAVCYVLQFVMGRFWWDLGVPALGVWLSLRIGEMLKKKSDEFAWKRVGVVVFLCITFYLYVTGDHEDRWTKGWNTHILSYENPADREWLPGPGGIVYADMDFFYKTFYLNPHGTWRYVMGFEPTMMTKENFDIHTNILSFQTLSSYLPWIRKMTVSDRIVIRRPPNEKPEISGIEWHYVPNDIWIGKKMAKGETP